MKPLILLIFLALNISTTSADTKKLYQELIEAATNNQEITSKVDEIINSGADLNIKFLIDRRNNHFGSPSSHGYTLAMYLIMLKIAGKKIAYLNENIIKVLRKTDDLRSVQRYSGWGYFDTISALAFTCDMDLFTDTYLSVPGSYKTINSFGDKKTSTLTAAYSGGCYEIFLFLIDKISPYENNCEFLKPPFNFKTSESEDIKNHLEEYYEITNYNSCLYKTLYHHKDYVDAEEELNKSTTNLINEIYNNPTGFITETEDALRIHGYNFPWNYINKKDNTSILFALADVIFKKTRTTYDEPARVEYGSAKLNLIFYKILKHTKSKYESIFINDTEYDLFSHLATKCHYDKKQIDYKKHNKTYKILDHKTNQTFNGKLLNFYVQNECINAPDFEENVQNIFEAGCQVLKHNYNPDSYFGRYLLNKYGFDDYEGCLEIGEEESI